jgi:hypothetical protein
VVAGASPLPYVHSRLEVPTRPGIGVDLDPDRIARYAELYERERHEFAFHDRAVLATTPVIPKL